MKTKTNEELIEEVRKECGYKVIFDDLNSTTKYDLDEVLLKMAEKKDEEFLKLIETKRPIDFCSKSSHDIDCRCMVCLKLNDIMKRLKGKE